MSFYFVSLYIYRVPFHAHKTHSATGATRKRFCFNVASGAQCDLC